MHCLLAAAWDVEQQRRWAGLLLPVGHSESPAMFPPCSWGTSTPPSHKIPPLLASIWRLNPCQHLLLLLCAAGGGLPPRPHTEPGAAAPLRGAHLLPLRAACKLAACAAPAALSTCAAPAAFCKSTAGRTARSLLALMLTAVAPGLDGNWFCLAQVLLKCTLPRRFHLI